MRARARIVSERQGQFPQRQLKGAINVRSIRFAWCFFGIVAAVWAQAVSTSQISGTVQDATGATVAAAQVRLKQTETGQVRTAATAADGSFLFTNLPIGPYRMEVSKEGFATYVERGIVLNVNTNPIINATLKVGSVSERVERRRWTVYHEAYFATDR